MRRLALVLLCVFMLSPASAQAAGRKLDFAMELNWPPLEFQDEGGNAVGYTNDLVAAIAAEGGIEYTIQNVLWQNIFSGLRDKRYDVVASSVTITPERLLAMDFSDPYLVVYQAVLTLAGDTLVAPDDLHGRVLGVQSSTTGHFIAQKVPGAFISAFDTVTDAMQALSLGQLDAVVCDEPVARYYARRAAGYEGVFKVAFLAGEEEYEEYGFAVRKGDAETLAVLNRALRTIKEKGLDKEIAHKWMGE